MFLHQELTRVGQVVDCSTVTPDSAPEDWRALIANLRSGATVQVSQAVYLYFLEVLPPHFMGYGRTHRHFGFIHCEGFDRPLWFWWEGAEPKGYHARLLEDWIQARELVDEDVYHNEFRWL